MSLDYTINEHKTTKVCNRCGLEKALFQFHKQTKGRLGRRPECVECRGCPRKLTKLERKEAKTKYIKNWQSENKEHLKNYRKQYYRDRFKTDIQFKLRVNIRQRVAKALKGNRKPSSKVKALGCSIPDLKKYLESKFLLGMSWNNYGRTGWHIDHVIPLASFDLTNISDFEKACHYTNLQPMWFLDNCKKGSS